MLDKKYSPATEQEIQAYWTSEGVFRFAFDEARPTYSIDTPPPTVSGKLHIGHIFSYTQAEMIARYHRLKGENVFYPFGFDDNGLPTERLVERERKTAAKSLPRSEFIALCKETVKKYEDEFRALWSSLGFSVDWDLQYETVSPLSQRVSQKSFLELAKAGHAYQKEKPVLWCTCCQTSIAQAELDSVDADTYFNWINFSCEGEPFEIATTRPELLYGCVAVMINPEDPRAAKYKGKTARVPLFGYEVPFILDEKVAVDKGTGVVMCCTFGDNTDLEWFETYNLPYRKVLEADGKLAAEVPFVAGMSAKEARKEIIEQLKAENAFVKSEPISHTISTHERCGTPVEILPSLQWYIDVLTKRDEYLAAGDEINWYPKSMKNRYEVWVKNLKWDWCISRQRYFGVPFPVWYCKACGAPLFAEESELPVNPLETMPEKACAKCGCREFTPESSVMDTWATSSTTPLINSHWKEPDSIEDKLMPMSMRTQAHEIIRTWAFYTIVKSLYHTGRIPWKDIMICGFVLAKKGEKISKSKNNSVMEPSELIAKYSADAVRYWAANNKLGSDTWFSEDEIAQSSRLITKLWNAGKFTLMQLEKYDHKKPEILLATDRWLLDSFADMQNRYIKQLEDYEVGSARHEIDEFFWTDYCDNYLEIAKERLYQPELHGYEAQQSGMYALYTVFHGILKLYSVFVPHVCEKIYLEYFAQYAGKKTIADCLLTPYEPDKAALAFGDALKEVVFQARRFKTAAGQSMKAPISSLVITLPADLAPLFEESKSDIIACLSVEKLTLQSGEALLVEIDGQIQ